MCKIIKVLINIAVACASASVTILLYNYFHRERNEVIFFYGQQPTCDYHLGKTTAINTLQIGKCYMCKVYKIIGWLNESRSTLDICMYMLTYNLFVNAIIDAHRRGVKVRLIVDEDNVSTTWKLGTMGISKKVKRKIYNVNLMHHKFIIIDNKKVILGSLNWTIKGVHNNWENTFLTNDFKLVGPFIQEFQRLWNEF